MLRICTFTKRPSFSQFVPVQKRYYERVAAKDAIKALSEQRGIFLDVRAPVAVQQFSAPGFINIPHYSIAEKLSTLNKYEAIYILDTSGFYSERVGDLLDSNKFADVRLIDGGLLNWVFSGGPLTSELPDVKAKLEEHKSLPPKFASAQIVEEKQKLKVDLSDKMFPNTYQFFQNPEEQKEANEKARTVGGKK